MNLFKTLAEGVFEGLIDCIVIEVKKFLSKDGKKEFRKVICGDVKNFRRFEVFNPKEVVKEGDLVGIEPTFIDDKGELVVRPIIKAVKAD